MLLQRTQAVTGIVTEMAGFPNIEVESDAAEKLNMAFDYAAANMGESNATAGLHALASRWYDALKSGLGEGDARTQAMRKLRDVADPDVVRHYLTGGFGDDFKVHDEVSRT